MFEAFTWMFKKENFKKHFLYLATIPPILCFIGIINFLLLNIAGATVENNNFLISIITFLLIFTGFCLPSGYFYDMTEKIIDRETRYTASNVYNGKGAKPYYVFDLPDFKIFKHIWRGFASFIATHLMFLPYIFLLIFTGYVNILAGTICQINPLIIISSCIFYCCFFPALLWNYARTNSIFAVLNIFKAINIIGNYTFSYIWRIIVFIIIYMLNYYIDTIIFATITPSIKETSTINIIIILIATTLIWIKHLYFWFVYAYLLGTLVPTEEV